MFAPGDNEKRTIDLQRRTDTQSSALKSTAFRLFAHTALVVGAIFVVTVLLAAMPGHNTSAVSAVFTQQEGSSQSPPADSQQMESMDHRKTPMDPDEKANEDAAVNEMNHMHGSGAHLQMTQIRPPAAADQQRATQIVSQLRVGIEKYRDYHVALNEGYHIFLPNVPQPEYHFTGYKHGFMAAWRFDPAQPTSLLYRKTADGYELVGAMYTMPKRATEDQLNERVPLSIAMWHLHTNLCMPPKDQRQTTDWTKFGLKGSIDTQQACDAADGKFYPTIFGWMVHVYPYEDSVEKVFAMHHHD